MWLVQSSGSGILIAKEICLFSCQVSEKSGSVLTRWRVEISPLQIFCHCLQGSALMRKSVCFEWEAKVDE